MAYLERRHRTARRTIMLDHNFNVTLNRPTNIIDNTSRPEDLCIIVENDQVTSPKRGSGYQDLTMSEVHQRLSAWNTLCTHNKRDIREIGDKSIKELTVPNDDHNEQPSLRRFNHVYPTKRVKKIKCKQADLQLLAREKHRYQDQSLVKSLFKREIMGTAGSRHHLLPADLFTRMKLFPQKFGEEFIPAKHLRFDRNGTTLMVAASKINLQFWDLVKYDFRNYMLSNGTQFQQIKYLLLNADETMLVGATVRGLVKVWDWKKRFLPNSNELIRINLNYDRLTQLEFSPAPINGVYCLIAMNSKGVMALLHLHYPYTHNDVLVTGISQDRYKSNGDEVKCRCSFSPCGRYVARSTSNLKIRVYTINKKFKFVKQSNEASMQLSIDGIIWAHHSSRFLTFSKKSCTTVWGRNFKVKMTLKLNDEVNSGMTKVCWTANDDWIITALADIDNVYVWDSTNGLLVRVIQLRHHLIRAHPIHPHLVAIVDRKGEMKLWNVTKTDTQELHKFEVDNGFSRCIVSHALCWSPDGTKLFAKHVDGAMIMYDLCEGTSVVSVPSVRNRLERKRKVVKEKNEANEDKKTKVVEKKGNNA